MSLALGIDVGTTFTAAAAWQEGRVEVIALETHLVTVPTVIFAEGDEMAFGTAAVARSTGQPVGLAREFKRRVGDPVPIVLSGAPYSADRLVALFGRWVVDRVTEQFGEPPSPVVVTHPANWTEFQLHLLRNALDQVGLGAARLLSEPQAAAHDFGAAARLAVGDLVLVYDLGGGTFDAALLRCDETGFTHVGEPAGVERLGGIDFDEAVFQHVVRHLPAGEADRAAADQTGRMALGQLRRSCVEAKETLSSQVSVDIPVVLPGHSSTVRLTRTEFEEMIRPMLRQTVDVARQVITRTGGSPEDLSALLLVGGSSRIPLVSELVRQELGVPVRVDAHPKLVVARGAARWAGEPPSEPAGAVTAGIGTSRGRRQLFWVAGAVALVATAGGAWYATAGGGGDPSARKAPGATEGSTLETRLATATSTEVTAAATTSPPSTAPPSTLPPPVEIIGLHPIGSAEIEPMDVGGYPVSLLTALTSEPATNRFFAISDTEEEDFEAAMFSFTIDLSSGRLRREGIRFESSTSLIAENNEPYGGAELDAEGMALTDAGTIVIASQGATADQDPSPSHQPFLHELDANGRFRRDWVLPDRYLPDPGGTKGIQRDGGIDPITAFDQAAQVLVGTRYPLVQDELSPGDDRNVRILVFDATSAETVSEYLYPLDPTHDPVTPDEDVTPSALLDLQAIDGSTTVIALERSSEQEPHRARLYQVMLNPAAAPAPSEAGPSTPLVKTFLADVDLNVVPAMRGLWQSMALGPELPNGRRSLILMRDTAAAGSPTWFRAYSFETEPAG
jgi:actin-like ATPase involved in cell morphogenesis